MLQVDAVFQATVSFFIQAQHFSGLTHALSPGTVARGLHDPAGSGAGTDGQAGLQPLAQHLASPFAWISVAYHQVFGRKLFVLDPAASVLCPATDSRRHLLHLQVLFAGLQEGITDRGVAEPQHFVEALHPQVGAGAGQK